MYVTASTAQSCTDSQWYGEQKLNWHEKKGIFMHPEHGNKALKMILQQAKRQVPCTDCCRHPVVLRSFHYLFFLSSKSTFSPLLVRAYFCLHFKSSNSAELSFSTLFFNQKRFCGSDVDAAMSFYNYKIQSKNLTDPPGTLGYKKLTSTPSKHQNQFYKEIKRQSSFFCIDARNNYRARGLFLGLAQSSRRIQYVDLRNYICTSQEIIYFFETYTMDFFTLYVQLRLGFKS